MNKTASCKYKLSYNLIQTFCLYFSQNHFNGLLFPNAFVLFMLEFSRERKKKHENCTEIVGRTNEMLVNAIEVMYRILNAFEETEFRRQMAYWAFGRSKNVRTVLNSVFSVDNWALHWPQPSRNAINCSQQDIGMHFKWNSMRHILWQYIGNSRGGFFIWKNGPICIREISSCFEFSFFFLANFI